MGRHSKNQKRTQSLGYKLGAGAMALSFFNTRIMLPQGAPWLALLPVIMAGLMNEKKMGNEFKNYLLMAFLTMMAAYIAEKEGGYDGVHVAANIAAATFLLMP